MKTNLKQAVAYAGLIAALCVGSVVHAQPFDDFGGMKEGMGERRKVLSDKLVKELNLTSEQEKQIRKQRKEKRKKNKTIRKKLGKKMKELREELEKQDVDKGKIDAIAEGIKALRGTLIDQRINAILAMKEILTPEQYEKLKELREKRRSERRKMRKGKKGKWRHKAK